MRQQFTNILKKQFRLHLIYSRDRLGISQEDMARWLHMSGRSYVELERGKNFCGTLTFILFLLYVCEDYVVYLEELRHTLEDSGKVA